MFSIEDVKRQVLIKYPIFASIILNTTYKETNAVKTSATDGKTIYYNAAYLETLPLANQQFILAHEVCHIAFCHILRLRGKNQKVWNTATDAIINQFLRKDGLTPIEGAVNIPDALDYDAEELYEKLLREGRQETGHDSHEMWEEVLKKDTKTPYPEMKDIEKRIFHGIQRKRQEQIKRIKEDFLQEEKNLLDNSRPFPEIRERQILINWHTFLRDSMKKDLDWSYQNAMIENGIVTPQLQEISYPEAEVLLDTSGSIREDQLRTFLMECRNLVALTNLKIGCFDQKFYGFHKIRSIKDLEEMPIHGGGGTDFNIALSAFDRRVENKILFTDGKAYMPKKAMYVLWIVMGEKIYPKGGKVIYISKEDIEKRKIKEKTR